MEDQFRNCAPYCVEFTNKEFFYLNRGYQPLGWEYVKNGITIQHRKQNSNYPILQGDRFDLKTLDYKQIPQEVSSLFALQEVDPIEMSSGDYTYTSRIYFYDDDTRPYQCKGKENKLLLCEYEKRLRLFREFAKHHVITERQDFTIQIKSLADYAWRDSSKRSRPWV